MIKIQIGGSPCTKWSIAQKNDREVEPKGIGWDLFENYLFAKKKFKPDFFLYENNKSAAQPIKDQISRELGVNLMHINSSLVSAQNRQRFYAFNWSVEPPEDRGILLRDIIESGEAFLDKSYALTTRCSGAIPEDTLRRHRHTMIAERTDGKNFNTRKKVYEVRDGEVQIKGKSYNIALENGFYQFRTMTPTECERLQTLPDGYTAAVSNAQRYKGLGNGWTADIIIHILNGALKDIPRDEEIVVLSMYDGIGTRRYCFDKMGFKNVTYYAYEIDEPAMKVALSNYPDIIQLGNAFDLRRDDWELGRRYDNEPTNLSNAPEEIKNEIIKNDELLRERDAEEETTEDETMETTTYNEQQTPAENVTSFDAVNQLRQLAEERKALAKLKPENNRFSDDVRAIEYAVSVLEAVGI